MELAAGMLCAADVSVWNASDVAQWTIWGSLWNTNTNYCINCRYSIYIVYVCLLLKIGVRIAQEEEVIHENVPEC